MPHLNIEVNHYLEEVPIETLNLLSDRVLCRVVKKAARVGTFRVFHYVYQAKTAIGRVLLIGEDYDGPCAPGDYIIFNPWGGREFQSPDETLILLRPSNIEAIIEREE